MYYMGHLYEQWMYGDRSSDAGRTWPCALHRADMGTRERRSYSFWSHVLYPYRTYTWDVDCADERCADGRMFVDICPEKLERTRDHYSQHTSTWVYGRTAYNRSISSLYAAIID